ncbi:MAG TPA: hypothetical protein VGL81_36310 [Polyangiaceae bacterium]|jgi:hypothetical protein
MGSTPAKHVRCAPEAGHAAALARGAASLLALGGALACAAGCVVPEREVRVRAASDFGCGDSQIQVEQLGASTYLATGCGQSDQYTCETRWKDLVCARDVAASTAWQTDSLQPRPPAPLLDPPPGAGGFAFGASEDDARRACEQAGHAYAPGENGHASCNGLAAEIGAPASATLDYRDGKVSAVWLQIALVPNENIARALTRWKAALVGQYGGPSASLVTVPSTCVDDVTPCLLDRSGSIRFDWRWRERLISVAPQVDGSTRPSVIIEYVALPQVRPGL